MTAKRRPWQEELEIIDRTMKAISGVVDPETLVETYWNGIGDLVPIKHYMALSRRDVEPPYYIVTRSSRFIENVSPFTDRDRLPRLAGGLAGEIAYANRPVIIDDLPARLKPDDPAWFYLEGFQALFALPQYDGEEGLNVTIMLIEPGLELDRAIIPMMHWQAGLFGRGTRNLVLRNQLSAALAALDRELEVVGDIQRSLLPQRLPTIPGFDLAAHYVTSARAGGDYYDFFPLAGERWGLFIADVSGHGTPAAVLMAITHALAHAQPGTHVPPQALLSYLNDHLVRSYTHNGTFVTAFYAVLDASTRTLTYTAGGHNPPRLLRDGQVLALDQSSELPLGISSGLSFGEASVMLHPGDLLVLYTDGVTEAMAPREGERPQELFGVERLDAALRCCGARTSAAECVACIRAAVTEFTRGASAADDQTLVALRCL